MITKVYFTNCQRLHKPSQVLPRSGTHLDGYVDPRVLKSIYEEALYNSCPIETLELEFSTATYEGQLLKERDITFLNNDSIQELIFEYAQTDLRIKTISFRPVNPEKQQTIFYEQKFLPELDSEKDLADTAQFSFDRTTRKVAGMIKPYSKFEAFLVPDDTLMNASLIIYPEDITDASENDVIRNILNLFMQDTEACEIAITTTLNEVYHFTKMT